MRGIWEMINQKKLIRFFYLFLRTGAVCVLLSVLLACGRDQNQLNFSISQDLILDQDGHVVVLRNKNTRLLPIWDFGFGRSYAHTDTLYLALAGEYPIAFSAISSSDTLGPEVRVVKVNKNNFRYLCDPLWDALSGGYGQQKTWLLDMNGCIFSSPLYIAGTSIGWNQQNPSACVGDECWWWIIEYSENKWVAEPIDHGRMTFRLNDTADILIWKATGETITSGTFMLDTARKVLQTKGAPLLHTPNWEAGVSNWNESKIISLTDHSMQLAFLRNQNSPDKNIQLVYNFISEDYYLSWLAANRRISTEKTASKSFVITGNQMVESLAGGPGQSKNWAIDQDWPIDWLDEAGNGWTTDYLSAWGWAWTKQCIDDTRDARLQFSNRNGSLYYSVKQFSAECHSMVSINPDLREINIHNCSLVEFTDCWLPVQSTKLIWIKGKPSTIKRDGIWLGINTKPGEYLAYHLVLTN